LFRQLHYDNGPTEYIFTHPFELKFATAFSCLRIIDSPFSDRRLNDRTSPATSTGISRRIRICIFIFEQQYFV